MAWAFGETVVLHSRSITGQDSDGNDVYGDTDATYPGVALYPRESVEITQGKNLNTIGLVAVFKPSILVKPTDEVTARGERWQVDAGYQADHSPLSGTNLTKVNLTRTEG